MNAAVFMHFYPFSHVFKYLMDIQNVLDTLLALGTNHGGKRHCPYAQRAPGLPDGINSAADSKTAITYHINGT